MTIKLTQTLAISRFYAFRTGFMFISLLFLYGCPPVEDPEELEEMQEFTFEYNCINTVTDCEPVDFMHGSNSLVSDLDYAAQSLYHDYTFKNTSNGLTLDAFVPDGSGVPQKVSNPFTIYNHEPFSFYLIGRKSDTSMKLISTDDVILTTNPGKSRLRLLHASPECPAVDILLIHAISQDTLTLTNRRYIGSDDITPSHPDFAFNLINSGDYDVVYLDHQTGMEQYRSYYTAPDAKGLTLILIGNPNGFWPFHLQDIPVWH